jgi:hypothetical protein
MPAKKTKSATKKSAVKKPTANKTSNSKQNELIIVMIISLILGLGGGYLIGANNTEDSSATTVSTETAKDSHMHMSTFDVPADQAPKVELVVSEDAKSGYNIKIITTDFTFTPEDVNGENVIGEGHAHLYVDGEKIGRVYGNYYHYGGSFEGTKSFRVTLNANDHSDYTVDGVAIESTAKVTHNSSDPDHDEMHMDSEMKSENEMHSDDTMHSDM